MSPYLDPCGEVNREMLQFLGEKTGISCQQLDGVVILARSDRKRKKTKPHPDWMGRCQICPNGQNLANVLRPQGEQMTGDSLDAASPCPFCVR